MSGKSWSWGDVKPARAKPKPLRILLNDINRARLEALAAHRGETPDALAGKLVAAVLEDEIAR